jgi:hypothetical protein
MGLVERVAPYDGRKDAESCKLGTQLRPGSI